MLCASTDGAACSAHGAGHALSAIHSRLASATPSKWRDGVAGVTTIDGWIPIELLETDAAVDHTVWVWNHNLDLVAPGEPVALHSVYTALAVGQARFNVLIAASLG
ncbi:hypothetical protein BHD05_14850 [Marisediminicola antarctica]|uniref:Uncharacterized protein n=2 Tax=Marisediminicola antarctica TaxID=674079 RepID=A0A7L5APN2_9MICO|nr:hypothetical protein BHD05_14850 [Marisediminicola antarctica]